MYINSLMRSPPLKNSSRFGANTRSSSPSSINSSRLQYVFLFIPMFILQTFLSNESIENVDASTQKYIYSSIQYICKIYTNIYKVPALYDHLSPVFYKIFHEYNKSESSSPTKSLATTKLIQSITEMFHYYKDLLSILSHPLTISVILELLESLLFIEMNIILDHFSDRNEKQELLQFKQKNGDLQLLYKMMEDNESFSSLVLELGTLCLQLLKQQDFKPTSSQDVLCLKQCIKYYILYSPQDMEIYNSFCNDVYGL